jgi:alkanesulfonate monooxygenase SsuD/methylene tetrahydromethanopterin reductase-like flavin-dependent oxidoreductase (luciferase family)
MTAIKHQSSYNVGFGIPHDISVKEIFDLARWIDEATFHSIWKSEDYYYRDGISVLAAIAGCTQQIKLGTGVINPYTRNLALAS